MKLIYSPMSVLGKPTNNERRKKERKREREREREREKSSYAPGRP